MEYFQLKTKVGLSVLPIAKFFNSGFDMDILGIGRVGIASSGYLTFCDRAVYSSVPIEECRSCILTSKEHSASVSLAYPNGQIIQVDDPRAAFIDAVQFLVDERHIAYSSLLPEQLRISPQASISAHARIEADVRIDAGVFVAAGAVIRSGTWLQSNCSVGENSVLGTNGIYVYIGLDGKRRRFPHLGSVVLEEAASLGAGCVVPRGILNSTRIGRGTIIGNLCNIGHGVEIESNAWISSSTVIGGQTCIGEGVTIGLGCAIKDNLKIGDLANIGMGSVVTKNIRSRQSVFGNPAKSFTSISAGPKR